MLFNKNYVSTYQILSFIHKHGHVTFKQIRERFPNLNHIEIVLGLLETDLLIGTVQTGNCVDNTTCGYYYLLNKGVDYYRDKRAEKFKVNISLTLSILAFCVTSLTLIVEVLKYMSEIQK